MSDSKQKMIGYLQQAVEDISLDRVVFGLNSPVPLENVTIHPCSRIIMPLSGSKKIIAAINGKRREIIMKPGDALFTERYGWSIPIWDLPQTMISVCYYEDYVRALYIETDGTTPHAKPKIFFHTPYRMDGAGFLLIQALNLISRQENSEEEACLLLKSLLIETLKLLRKVNDSSSKAHYTFSAVCDFLYNNYQRSSLSREETARKFHLSASYLSRLFKKHANCSFSAFLEKIRLENALHLLVFPELSIAEIADQCGYSYTSYFIKIFRRHFGASPGEFRQQKMKKTK